MAAGGDTELGIDAVEMRPDRAVRQKQPLADLPVRQPAGCELGDLELLRGEAVARFRVRGPTVSPVARSSWRARVLHAAAHENVEHLDAPPQRSSRVRAATAPAQPASKGQQCSRLQERIVPHRPDKGGGEERLGVVGCEQWSGALELDAEERYVAARRNVFEVCYQQCDSVDVPAAHSCFDNVEHRRPAHEAMEHGVVLVEDRPEMPKRVVVAAATQSVGAAREVHGCQQRRAPDREHRPFRLGEACVQIGCRAQQGVGDQRDELTRDSVLRLPGVLRQRCCLLTGRNRRGPFTRLGRRPCKVHERLGQRDEPNLCSQSVDSAGQETRSQREVTGFLRRDADMHRRDWVCQLGAPHRRNSAQDLLPCCFGIGHGEHGEQAGILLGNANRSGCVHDELPRPGLGVRPPAAMRDRDQRSKRRPLIAGLGESLCDRHDRPRRARVGPHVPAGHLVQPRAPRLDTGGVVDRFGLIEEPAYNVHQAEVIGDLGRRHQALAPLVPIRREHGRPFERGAGRSNRSTAPGVASVFLER